MPLDDFHRHFSQRFAHVVGQRVVVAVSGGPDSVALLHLMRDPALRLQVEAAHVHHAVRGVEADRDAAFCECLCDRLGVRYHLLRIEVEPSPPDGREAAWRRLRYRALTDLAHRLGAEAVATAHHRDDVAEGVMLQLLRGTGPRALAGIEDQTSDGVIRPLLPWRRADILQWLRHHGVGWIEDSSNREMGHLRNRVRHMVLPELRAASPRIDDHLVHLASTLAADESHFAAELLRADLWIEPWRHDGGVAVEDVRRLPAPLRSRWLHAQAARIGLSRVSRRQIDLFQRMLDTASPRSVSLAQRWAIRMARQQLWLEPPKPPAGYRIELEEGPRFELSIPGWWVRVTREPHPSPRAEWSCRFASIDGLIVRTPSPGDTIERRDTPVRIARLMARAIPRHLRHGWPLFCENARIAWIPGVWQGPCRGDLLVEVLTDG